MTDSTPAEIWADKIRNHKFTTKDVVMVGQPFQEGGYSSAEWEQRFKINGIEWPSTVILCGCDGPMPRLTKRKREALDETNLAYEQWEPLVEEYYPGDKGR